MQIKPLIAVTPPQPAAHRPDETAPAPQPRTPPAAPAAPGDSGAESRFHAMTLQDARQTQRVLKPYGVPMLPADPAPPRKA